MASKKKNIVLTNLKSKEFPDVEYHLFRLSNFFVEEQVHTTFPDARDFQKASQTACSYYSLFTFQPNRGALTDATEEELLEESDAFRKGVSHLSSGNSADNVSELIGYTPESKIWKDESREVFFAFMRHVDSELQKAMDGDGTVESGDKYFFDWSDPATGLPINSRRGPSILVDNDLLERFFSFNSVYVCVGGGGCRMIEHPKLGLNVYPASGIICVANDDLPLLTDVLTRLSVTS